MLLAIDTATRTMSIALHTGSELLAEQTWITPNQHNSTLAPAVHQMLAVYGTTVAQLKAVAVCTGPGSFTGLRVGVSLAKGLAAAHHLPLVGCSTLDILAAGQPNFNGVLICVAQAGRGRIITNSYRWRKGRWMPRDDEARLTDWTALLENIEGAACVTGEVDDDGRLLLGDAAARGLPVVLAPAVHRLRRAGFLAQEAWALLEQHPLSSYDPARVNPHYIKTDAIL